MVITCIQDAYDQRYNGKISGLYLVKKNNIEINKQEG